MQQLKFHLLLLLFVLSVLPVQADEDRSNAGITGIKVEKQMPPFKNGPRKPSNQFLMFYYDSGSGQCEVQLGADMEWASVTIEQIPVGFYYVGEVSQEVQSFSVEIPAGYYRITCETDGGSTFIGEGDLD